MKTMLVLGSLLVAAAVVAVPVASAHFVINVPVPFLGCIPIGFGDPTSPPHGSFGIAPCPHPAHGEPAPGLLP